jgi:hypothetical protein
MNPRSLDRAGLVKFARNAAGAIAAGKVKGFTPEQNGALSAALAAETEALQNDNDEVVGFQTKFHEHVALAQARQNKILKMLTENKFAMRGVSASEDQYEALGFDPPADRASRVKPKTPSKLAVTGRSNGVNKLTFRGNNVSGRVIYDIEANRGDGWFLLDSTRKRTYEHKGVKPGERYEYRIRSKATRGQVSQWSNKAAVYEDF